MTARTGVSFVLAAASVLLFAASAARADAIDGDWCNPGGKRLSIEGADIRTPGRRHTKGNYDRHAFSYEVPDSEPGAGTTIYMILIDDETMYLRAGKAPGYGAGEADVWRRCTPPVS
jgi:hypothetical protein